MANNAIGKTTQEYLNNKAGFTGPLRTCQECLASLTGRANATNSVITTQDQANTYAGTTGRTEQEALNVKVAMGGGSTLSKQEAARRL